MDHDRGGPYNVAALDTKVSILTQDVEGINHRISSLDEKFDKVLTSFASEFRSAIAGLSAQFSERNRTPWGILISGMGVILTVVTVLGHQTLTPITDALRVIGENMVPRKEVEFRYGINDHRITRLEVEFTEFKKREEDDLRQRLAESHRENQLLRFPPAKQ